MTRLVVVFDSNAYRELPDGDASTLSASERAVGVNAVASKFVCYELLSHLADANDNSLMPAWRALRRLAQHCAIYDGSRRIIRFHVGADEQMCVSLFGKRPQQPDAIDQFGSAVGGIVDAEELADLMPYQRRIQATADFVRTNEENWARTIATGINNVIKADGPRWAPELSEPERRKRTAQLLKSPAALAPCARMFVNNASHLHKLVVTDRELASAASRCEQMFPVPLRLYNSIIAKVAENADFNLAKRANLLWDLQLAFTASPNLTADGCPVWLITSDRAILDAARDANATHFVRSLVEYKATISGGIDAILSALDETGEAI